MWLEVSFRLYCVVWARGGGKVNNGSGKKYLSCSRENVRMPKQFNLSYFLLSLWSDTQLWILCFLALFFSRYFCCFDLRMKFVGEVWCEELRVQIYIEWSWRVSRWEKYIFKYLMISCFFRSVCFSTIQKANIWMNEWHTELLCWASTKNSPN